MIGSSALRSACRPMTRRSPSPLARAVRTKSDGRISSIAPRVMRARNAIDRVPSVSAGSTRNARPPYPDGGSQRSATANNRISSRPTQYTGNEIPKYAISMLNRSIIPPGRIAASTPRVMPQVAARSIAAPASCSVFGKRSARSPRTGRCVM